MSQKIEEFKEFIKQNPRLKILVDKREKTWQNLFEEWSILGSENTKNNYKEGESEIKNSNPVQTSFPVNKEIAQLGEMMKTCFNYVKKINPDNVTKTITNAQKMMALIAGLGAANTFKAANNRKMTGDPLFDKKFDDWY